MQFWYTAKTQEEPIWQVELSSEQIPNETTQRYTQKYLWYHNDAFVCVASQNYCMGLPGIQEIIS
jgi:hypothetical protein